METSWVLTTTVITPGSTAGRVDSTAHWSSGGLLQALSFPAWGFYSPAFFTVGRIHRPVRHTFPRSTLAPFAFYREIHGATRTTSQRTRRYEPTEPFATPCFAPENLKRRVTPIRGSSPAEGNSRRAPSNDLGAVTQPILSSPLVGVL